MTNDELNALTQLLQRVPMSGAEVLWVNELLARLRREIDRRVHGEVQGAE